LVKVNAILRTLGRAKSTERSSLENARNTPVYLRIFSLRMSKFRANLNVKCTVYFWTAPKGNVLTYIETKIKANWSPEQILMLEKGIAISHEAIYQYVGRDRQTCGQLYVAPKAVAA
jgi:IS30 family transposase